MKTSHWPVGFLVFLCVTPLITLAAPFDDFNIYYINGMNNNQSEAQKSTRLLKQLALPDAPNVDKLYQNNERILSELKQVYKQALADGNRQRYKNFWLWVRKWHLAPDAFLQKVLFPVLKKYDEATYTADPDLQAMITKITTNASVRKKTILVTHSQGGFYANQIVNYLASTNNTLKNCVGVVSVATPATYVAGNGPWTTLSNDIVINLARTGLPWGALIKLPAPALPIFSANDPSGHLFVESYAMPLSSRIRNQILDVANKLNLSCTMPCPTEFVVPYTYTLGNWSKDYRWTVGAGTHNIVGSFLTNRTFPNVMIFANETKLWASDPSINDTQSFNFAFDASTYGTTDLVFRVAQTGIYNSGFILCAGCGAEPASCYDNLPPPPPPPPPVAKTISFNFIWTNNSQWSCDSGDAVVDGTISLGKIGYNGSKTVSLTPGAHSIVFTGTPYLGCTCLRPLGCLLGSIATYTINSGFTSLATATLTQRYTQTISFTVP